MKAKFPIFITLVVLILAMLKTKAQTNNLPDSILALETFGTGMNKANLPAGRTTYKFNGNSHLNDGDYMIYRYTNGRPEWHNTSDHTGNTNGRSMIINAGLAPSEFYRDTLYNLQGNTVYNVSLYLMNTNTLGTCGSSALLPNIQCVVEYYNQSTANYQQLITFNTGFIQQAASPVWVLKGATFVNPAGNSIIRYRLINNSTGGCGNDLAIDDISFARGATLGTLPVSGFQLFAQANAGAVTINWQTLTESNTSYFIAERSTDMINWVKVDSVQAAGYSNSQKKYAAADYKISQQVYYRIKQVDKNGQFSYSNIIGINNLAAGSAKAYPNPCVNSLQIDIHTVAAQKSQIVITDVLGKILLQKNWMLEKGSNTTSISDVKQFTNGMYFLQVKAHNGNTLFKTNILKN